MILAIETSCDDSCAAVLTSSGDVLSSVVGSQVIHDLYGGVVPEIAARHHLELLLPVVERALAEASIGLADLESVAVTQGPGLVGALLVGLATAKGLAAGLGIPLRAVDHLHGHVAASYLAGVPLEPPFLCLVASGGHTLIANVQEPGPNWSVVGTTIDDAAGEAFDKGARILGLGYPGGPLLEEQAKAGDPDAFDFPRAKGVAGADFSFAGLKTSLLYAVRDLGEADATARRADLAASYQAAIVDQLVERVTRAVDSTGVSVVAFGGGVAANSSARLGLTAAGIKLVVPPRKYCTDNAAMIGRASLEVQDLPHDAAFSLDAYSTATRAGR
ncbi:MAG: tRNA (adenosine(37)-N6)-threonylcarbamoyltransferase complex transferase subunit TsaD [Actinobacteria bacterium]|uniref:N(6)-L-threonylcarbamoyladenine synthase n=1 Tax=freshwater metagenome TaxID=449393 RepID=A0A6J7CPR3_9ZZZZ|nr:tRNA (adenosine(37)-N6)-threonylcarbamoyltransferase complex transferase subunit TsaD [Actinomycetota bacterium]